jgi:hypothetical protein
MGGNDSRGVFDGHFPFSSILKSSLAIRCYFCSGIFSVDEGTCVGPENRQFAKAICPLLKIHDGDEAKTK